MYGRHIYEEYIYMYLYPIMWTIPLEFELHDGACYPKKNSDHFNIVRYIFGDMCVDTVMRHHHIEASFGLLKPAGVPFYRDFLVGGLEHFLFSHILGMIIPTD